MSNILRELTHENIAVLNNDECSSDVLAFINQSAWLWSAQQSQLQLGFGIFQVLLQHRTSPKRVRQKFHPKVANFCQTLCTFSVISPIRKCQRSLYLQGYWVVEEEVANIANKESGMPSLKYVIGYAWTTTNISGCRTNTGLSTHLERTVATSLSLEEPWHFKRPVPERNLGGPVSFDFLTDNRRSFLAVVTRHVTRVREVFGNI